MLRESRQAADRPHSLPYQFSSRSLKMMLNGYEAATIFLCTSLIVRTSRQCTSEHITACLAYGMFTLFYSLAPLAYMLLVRKPVRGFLKEFDFLDFCLALAGVSTLCSLI